MPSLRECQEDFTRSMRFRSDGGIARHVLADGIESEQRLQIYRNNIRANFLATMQATYPIIERLGGSDWFAQSVERYRISTPSRCGDLQYVGAAYSQFLHHEMRPTAFGYFADIARLEWAYQDVLTAAPASPIAFAAIGGIDLADHPRIVFVPCDAVRLVESPIPILDIWNANQLGDVSDDPIHLDAGGQSVLLIRRSDHVELRLLRAPLACFMRQIIAGLPLACAVEAVAADCEDFDLVRELSELLALQVITALQISKELP